MRCYCWESASGPTVGRPACATVAVAVGLVAAELACVVKVGWVSAYLQAGRKTVIYRGSHQRHEKTRQLTRRERAGGT